MKNPTRIAGVLMFILAAGFMTVLMLGPAMAPGYDIRDGAISDLGTVTETALMFNGALVAVGVLNLLAGWLLAQGYRRAWILPLFAVAGIGAAGAGIFPLDSGGPHGLFALVAFIAFNLQALASASITTGPMRFISAGAGILGVVFVVLMAVGDSGNVAAFGPIGHGATERMIVYPAMLWMLAFGGYLMAPRRA